MSVIRRSVMLPAAGSLVAGRARAATAIKIGILMEMSGTSAEDSARGSVIAAQMAIEDACSEYPDLAVELVSGDAIFDVPVSNSRSSG